MSTPEQRGYRPARDQAGSREVSQPYGVRMPDDHLGLPPTVPSELSEHAQQFAEDR